MLLQINVEKLVDVKGLKLSLNFDAFLLQILMLSKWRKQPASKVRFSKKPK